MVDTDVYMQWLLGEVRRRGLPHRRAEDQRAARRQAEALARQFEVDAIVNCAGLGAGELTGESMYPLRGRSIRVRNDGKAMPRVTEAHCISLDDSDQERGFVFIVPRGENMLVLGGLAEPDEWDLDIGLHNYEPVREMYRRCLEFMPALEARRDRRGRAGSGRDCDRCATRMFALEAEPGTRIVHNYGHGGSGVTFSWGCAMEVADLVERTLRRRRMALALARRPRDAPRRHRPRRATLLAHRRPTLDQPEPSSECVGTTQSLTSPTMSPERCTLIE